MLIEAKLPPRRSRPLSKALNYSLFRTDCNYWQAAPNQRWSRPAPAGTPFQAVNNTEQILIENPPPGNYDVEVIAEVFPANAVNQFNAQPFALVFVGSGPEVRFAAIGGMPAAIPLY